METNRDHFFTMRMTTEERKILGDAARIDGRSVGNFIVRIVMPATRHFLAQHNGEKHQPTTTEFVTDNPVTR